MARVQALRDAAVAVNPEILVLCHGGPIAEPSDAGYVLARTTGVCGFFGASSQGIGTWIPRSPGTTCRGLTRPAWRPRQRPAPLPRPGLGQVAARISAGVSAAIASPTGSRPGRAVMTRTMASSSPPLSRANTSGAPAAGP